MRLKEHSSPMQFIVDRFQPLLNTQIQDLTALQQNYSESILVALDTESLSQSTEISRKSCQDVSEIGIAILRLNSQVIQPYECIKQLHYEGGAEAFTIQIQE
ncbi:hypothetical protein GQ44DRAFT_726505 [Phaeosphaeriaceae sp. PMI808]|nr:hypothetical protein GQ44DRAFT_726505 [Phaeosphaeriaceae sp. PMI808]